VVGSITRESVKKALSNGITADQVCHSVHTDATEDETQDLCGTDYQVSHRSCAPADAEECKASASLLAYSMEFVSIGLFPQNPLIPVTVQDQVRLWELEKNRLKSQEGLFTV
jgi:transcription initiation factor TFIIH subunit 4